jgi:hypothetical protein
VGSWKFQTLAEQTMRELLAQDARITMPPDPSIVAVDAELLTGPLD